MVQSKKIHGIGNILIIGIRFNDMSASKKLYTDIYLYAASKASFWPPLKLE